MGSGEPNADELIVKAQYFFPIEPTEENLRSVQNRLAQIMMEEGFDTSDAPMPYLAIDRSMEFLKIPPAGENSWWGKLQDTLGLSGDEDPRERLRNSDKYLEGLGKMVDEVPFRVVFRFKTFHGEDVEGYDVFIESIPVLLQKYRQLQPYPDYDYNIDNVVGENKREIRRILGRLELEPTHGPYTEAESLDSRLSEQTVEKLDSHQYGRTTVQYVNEGDQCLQQNMLHAALSCYIQAIEWAILHHKVTEDDEDLIEQQQSGEIGPVYFKELVSEVDDVTEVSQKTVSKLKNFNSTERRWIAHHKSGQLERQDVENVRFTLLRLTDELLKPIACISLKKTRIHF